MRSIISIFASLFCLYSVTTLAAEDIQSLHLDWLDKNVKPEQNFFSYANGNWQKQHPIPNAYSRWGIFEELEEQNQILIKDLIETAAKNPKNKPGSIEQKVGDYYYSGMDEASINKLGITPIQAE